MTSVFSENTVTSLPLHSTQAPLGVTAHKITINTHSFVPLLHIVPFSLSCSNSDSNKKFTCAFSSYSCQTKHLSGYSSDGPVKALKGLCALAHLFS